MLLSADEHEVLAALASGVALVWNISSLPKGSIFSIACTELAERSFDDQSVLTGRQTITPICTGDEPLPGVDSVLSVAVNEQNGKSGLNVARYLLFQRQFDRSIDALHSVELYGGFQDKLHASVLHGIASAFSGELKPLKESMARYRGEIASNSRDGASHASDIRSPTFAKGNAKLSPAGTSTRLQSGSPLQFRRSLTRLPGGSINVIRRGPSQRRD